MNQCGFFYSIRAFIINIFVICLGVSALLVYSAPAASARSEFISSFITELVVTSNGLNVTETITYEFGDNIRRGIERDIPLRDQDGSEFFLYDINVLSVTADNSPVNIVHDSNLDYLKLRIGDPNITVSGQVVYKIKYIVKGSLVNSSNGTFLSWDAVGQDWDVLVDIAQVIVNKDSLYEENLLCFQGDFFNSRPCQDATSFTGFSSFLAGPLMPGEAVTITGFSPLPYDEIVSVNPDTTGVFKGSIGDRFDLGMGGGSGGSSLDLDVFTGFNLVVVVFFLISLLLGLLGSRSLTVKRFIGFFVKNRFEVLELDKNSVPPFFAPPQDLSPAELSISLNVSKNYLNPEALAATIFDLATRSYLELSTTYTKEGLVVSLKKTQGKGSLKSWEFAILQELFKNSDSIVLDSPIPSLGPVLVEVTKNIKTDLQSRNLMPSKTRSLGSKSTIVSASVFVLGFISITFPFLLPFFMIPLSFAILYLFFSPKFIRKPVNPVFKNFRVESTGFEKFLTTKSSLDRVDFVARMGLQVDDFASTLFPYAVIFGVSDSWLNSFANLNLPNVENNLNLPNGFLSSSSGVYSTLLVSNIKVVSAPLRNSSGYSGSTRAGSRSGFSRAGSGGGGGGGRSW